VSSPSLSTLSNEALALRASASAGQLTPDIRGWTEISWSNEGIEYWRRGDRLFLPPSEEGGEWREMPSPPQPTPLRAEEDEWRELPLPSQPKRRHRQCTQRPPVPNAERVSIDKAVAVLGLPKRTVQELAARGEIAGAAKIGRRWTFDIEKLRRLVRQRERETWQSGKRRPDATGGAIPSGHGLRFVGAKSDGRFTQVTRRLRGRNIRSGGSG
jgi:Helix-turn-helix domain